MLVASWSGFAEADPLALGIVVFLVVATAAAYVTARVYAGRRRPPGVP